MMNREEKPMNNAKVLVVDDEEFIRELIKDFLEMESVCCDGAETPEEAFALIGANDYRLILLDRNLRNYKAEDLIQRMHEIKPGTPIVILTGDVECNREYFTGIGASGIVFKPFQVSDFMMKIEPYLEKE